MPGPAARLVVRAEILRIAEMDSVRLAVSVVDSAGLLIADAPVSFSSSSPGVATASDSGWVKALVPGWSLIHVTSGQLRDSVWVGVSMRFASVTAGSQYACGITQSHDMYCWGANNKYDAGSIDYREPVITTPTFQAHDVAAVAGGYYHNCLAATTGNSYCWGRDYEAQRGDGDAISYTSTTPRNLQLPEPLISISARDDHTCGVTASQRVFCWGRNEKAQTGVSPDTASRRLCGGYYSCTTSPVEVPGVHLKAVSAGEDHTCGIDEQGTAYCWGSNLNGELGTGSIGDTVGPSPVNTTLRFKVINSGYQRTCALSIDGSAYCWGGDNHVTVPTSVNTADKFQSISVFEKACGVTTSGLLQCWDDANTPTLLSAAAKFQTVTLGWQINCALDGNGAAWCWGDTKTGSGFDARQFPIMVAPPGPVLAAP